MYSFVIGLIIFFAIMLVLVILAQNSKGGGLSGQFGGSGASNIMGVKKTGDLLEKLTWTFVVAIMVLGLSTNFIHPTATQSSGSDILDKAREQGSTTAPSIPGLDDNIQEEITVPDSAAD